MNYVDLKANLQSWIQRTDLDNTIPTFIKWGQDWIEEQFTNKNVRNPIMEYESSSTTYIPTGINTISIPNDYIELMYIHLTDQLHSPVMSPCSAGAGSLIAGTYYYVVSAINQFGETLVSSEVSQVLAAPGGVNINWTKVTGVNNATGYKVYGRTQGGKQLIATLGDVSTYLDNGTITPSGALPTENTSGSTRFYPLDRYDGQDFVSKFYNINKSQPARPCVYTRKDGNFLLDNYADKDYVYSLRYYRKLPVLSQTITTNGWTDTAEELLLYSSICKAIPYLKDDPASVVWLQTRNARYEELKLKVIREAISGQRIQESPNHFRTVHRLNW